MNLIFSVLCAIWNFILHHEKIITPDDDPDDFDMTVHVHAPVLGHDIIIPPVPQMPGQRRLATRKILQQAYFPN